MDLLFFPRFEVTADLSSDDDVKGHYSFLIRQSRELPNIAMLDTLQAVYFR